MMILQRPEQTSREPRPACFLANNRFAERASTKSRSPAPQRLVILELPQKPFDYGTECFLPNLFVFGSPSVELRHTEFVSAPESLIRGKETTAISAGVTTY
jgi:hypothetical protein